MSNAIRDRINAEASASVPAASDWQPYAWRFGATRRQVVKRDGELLAAGWKFRPMASRGEFWAAPDSPHLSRYTTRRALAVLDGKAPLKRVPR